MATGRIWTPRWIVALMMALIGVLTFIALLIQDMRTLSSLSLETLPWDLVRQYLVAMALGSAVAGVVTASLFGRSRVRGWILALFAGLFASLIAGAFGGAFGEMPALLRDGWHMSDLVPIAFGAVLLPLAAYVRPALLLVWLALVILTHIWARRARRAAASPA